MLLISIISFSQNYQRIIYIGSRFGITRDPRGQPLRHMEQLLLVTSFDSPAGIGASLRTDERTDERTDGHTDVTLEIVC